MNYNYQNNKLRQNVDVTLAANPSSASLYRDVIPFCTTRGHCPSTVQPALSPT